MVLNPEQFYHGSSFYMKPGDIIKPNMAHGPDDKRGARTYVATHPSHANLYTGNMPYANGPQGELFGTIYTAEPVDSEEKLRRVTSESLQSDEVSSTEGFRVTGIHSFEPHNSNIIRIQTPDGPIYLDEL